jgi:hypothetical protein
MIDANPDKTFLRFALLLLCGLLHICTVGGRGGKGRKKNKSGL